VIEKKPLLIQGIIKANENYLDDEIAKIAN
jgi:hypothetical protein